MKKEGHSNGKWKKMLEKSKSLSAFKMETNLLYFKQTKINQRVVKKCIYFAIVSAQNQYFKSKTLTFW